MTATSPVLRQRADYTHKHNSKTGRHGWLRLTPAYSLKIVEEIIASSAEDLRIFDPFCGTATTALSASYRGSSSVTTDINPFLIWLGNTKLGHYNKLTVLSAKKLAEKALDEVNIGAISPSPAPPIFNIERWWSPESLVFLTKLRAAIDHVTVERTSVRDLLLISFCRTLISLSSASFNHQSMSFKNNLQDYLHFPLDMHEMFISDVEFVLTGASLNPAGKASIYQLDARALNSEDIGKFDLVVTSPPYANRMSYIRELRPYMYWLGFLNSGRDAGELDWTAIGGTWGIATSRLADWTQPSVGFSSATLNAVARRIHSSDHKNGMILSIYVRKYFYDMWLHFQSLRNCLNVGAHLNYIVGNSTFYNNIVPTEAIYAEILVSLGFLDVKCTPIRKRNSKKELVEYNVSARWT